MVGACVHYIFVPFCYHYIGVFPPIVVVTFSQTQVLVSVYLSCGILQLRRYEEAIRLCEQSMAFAERNFSGCEINQVKLWRWFFISKSHFHLGRLEAALDLLEKLEKVGSTKEM